ncbi:MAG: ATP-dependent sacrificial sulfur transferase LarE [Planctomycetota bacterium]
MDAMVHEAEAAGLWARLVGVIEPRGSVMTAFSGGVDSTVVAAAAVAALGRDRAPAAVGDSKSLPRRELAGVRALVAEIGAELVEVSPGEQDDARYRANAGDRCYYCKTHLYGVLADEAERRGVRHLANGTNTDDLGDHRPGLTAADEAAVISPLIDAGLNKAQVRAVARWRGLSNWDKPASACLASRIPYGTEVTPRRLQEVEDAEAALAELGYAGFRVRHHERVARLEFAEEDLVGLVTDAAARGRVVEAVKAAGFAYVAIDLEGFRSGSGNVVLTVSGSGGR